MPYQVAIRDNTTGEIRIASQDLPWDDENDEGHIYWWTEGNMGCDCNRKMEFLRAGGMEETDVWQQDTPCGDGAFSVLAVKLDSGRIIPIEVNEFKSNIFLLQSQNGAKSL